MFSKSQKHTYLCAFQVFRPPPTGGVLRLCVSQAGTKEEKEGKERKKGRKGNEETSNVCGAPRKKDERANEKLENRWNCGEEEASELKQLFQRKGVCVHDYISNLNKTHRWQFAAAIRSRRFSQFVTDWLQHPSDYTKWWWSFPLGSIHLLLI